MQQRYITLAAQSSDTGKLVAYASVYDVRSEQGIIIERGAFAPYLEQLQTRGYLLYNHDSMGLPVGMITRAVEDDVGLLIEAEWHEHDEAQRVRTMVNERLQRGLYVGMSIGFYPIDYDYRDDGATLVVRQADIRECSVVLFPDNPEARVLISQSMQMSLEAAMELGLEAVAAIDRCADRARAIAKLRADKNKQLGKSTQDLLRQLSHTSEQIASAAARLARVVDEVLASPCSDAATQARAELLSYVEQLSKEIEHETQ
ncbi:MAG: hypothetical protein KatS3mg038_2319 [Candidatus Kapaibacterium sp.]|nr:MAG: hypothetical protein KatS3mg038_2319 [Candidatus Kapabacteria bacterium]